MTLPNEIPVERRDIRRRLADAGQALSTQAGRSPEERRAILEARAQALARKPVAEAEAGVEILGFSLGEERYAIESAWVSEVAPLRDLSPLPGTPAFVLGIVHLRGQIVSVLDLRKLFDLPDKGLANLDRLILLADGSMQFAIAADRIHGVRELARAELQPPLPTPTGARTSYLLGLAGEGEIVLDGRKLLADPAIIVAEEPIW